MQLTMKVGDFEALVKRVIQFAARGRDIHPGFRLVRVEVTDSGRVRVSAHNAQAGARASTAAVASEPGVIAVTADHLGKIIGILPKGPGQDVVLKVGRGPKVQVACQHVRLAVPRAEVEDFPPQPQPPAADAWYPVLGQRLLDVIKRLLWAMCRDMSRPQLAGVHLAPGHSETCDGFLTARLAPGLVPAGREAVVPGDTWHNLRAFVGKDDELRMAIDDDRRIWFRGRDWAVFSTLIHGQYPDMGPFIFAVDADGYHHIGDKRLRVHSIRLNRKEVIATVSRIIGASVSQEEKSFGASVKFEMRDGSLHLVSHYPIDDMSNSIIVDERVDWAEDSIVADDLSGFDAMSGIGLYSTYMKMALESLSSDLVRVMWAEPLEQGFAPVQFHDDDAGMKALVMPRRL